MSRTRHNLDHAPAGLARDKVKAAVADYHGFYDQSAGADAQRRKRHYSTLVNHYYDLVTDFYEFGWGQSFHFAPRQRGESFEASLIRYERFLSDRLELGPGMTALDVGCGVGGPMREIARHSGAHIVGVNNNAYQISRAQKHNRQSRLEQQCSLIKADFMRMPLPANHFDAVYAIEATPHAPDKTALFRELHRVMKPGAGFAGYEWCLTRCYDADNPDHRRLRRGLEEGTSLPDLAFEHEVVEALLNAGFEIFEYRDVAHESAPQTPWYRALQGRDLSLKSLPRTPIGRAVTSRTTRVLETLRIAPQGTTEVSRFLNQAADVLVEAGETGIFTPMFYFHAQKPESRA